MIAYSNMIREDVRQQLYDTIRRELNPPLSVCAEIWTTLCGKDCMLYIDRAKAVGGVGFTVQNLPTGEKVLAEKMLYVVPEQRFSGIAHYLLSNLERVARRRNCNAIVAGSSLGFNGPAKTVYEDAGFRTTLSFRKDLNNV